jgi:hypothetical protein
MYQHQNSRLDECMGTLNLQNLKLQDGDFDGPNLYNIMG